MHQFQFGLFEWLWRTLTYWHLHPFAAAWARTQTPDRGQSGAVGIDGCNLAIALTNAAAIQCVRGKTNGNGRMNKWK
jgi:hypothetical protein